jgi:hypothetical protein
MKIVLAVVSYLIIAGLTYGYVVNRPQITTYPDCHSCVVMDAHMAGTFWPLFWVFYLGSTVTR